MGQDKVRECNFCSSLIDQHTDLTVLERTIRSCANLFPIYQKRKVTSIRHNFDCITICRSLSNMVFTSKRLVPELGPGIRLATIILAELVLRIIISGFYLKAIKCLIVLILLIVPQHQTKKIELVSISSCVVTFYFIDRYRIGKWLRHVFIWQERNC